MSKHLLTRERADEPKRLNLTHMHCCLLCRCVFAWTWTPILPLVVFYLDKGACNIPKHAGQAERSDLRGSHWDNARLLPIISPVRYKTRIYPTLAFIYSCARGARVNNKHTPSLTANRNVCHCLSAPPPASLQHRSPASLPGISTPPSMPSLPRQYDDEWQRFRARTALPVR